MRLHALSLVNAIHITASVFINDDERGLHQHCDDWLEELAPHEPVSKYRHNRTGESLPCLHLGRQLGARTGEPSQRDNADAHLKRAAETGCTSQIMGREVVVAITTGHVDFGPREQIFYGEFDERRRKRVLVKIIGE